MVVSACWGRQPCDTLPWDLWDRIMTVGPLTLRVSPCWRRPERGRWYWSIPGFHGHACSAFGSEDSEDAACRAALQAARSLLGAWLGQVERVLG